MAVTAQQLQDEDDAYEKQVVSQQSQQKTQENLQDGKEQQPSFLSKWVTGPLGKVSTDMLDSAVSAADSYFNSDAGHKARDVAAGAMTGAANMGDAGVSALKGTANTMLGDGAGDLMSKLTSPIWDHAKSTLLDFRDAVAVQDPTMADSLVQGVGQLAIPFAGYSRALAGVHGFANTAVAGGLTDATALGPQDPRMADLLALGKHVEGKFGDALNTLAPDGGALNAYINYLSDRTDETEAEGRFKNVLDGFGVNAIATPLLHTVGSMLKQGSAGLRYAIENGVGSMSDLMPANQDGKIVFHGTRSDISPTEGFNNDKLLTGEGSNAFGAGHYFAENPDTAGTYARRNVERVHPDISSAANDVESAGGKQQAVKTLNAAADSTDNPAEAMFLRRKAQLIKSGAVDKATGNLYSVDIPDKHIEKMVDWDAPLSEQPPSVRDTFAAHGIDEANMTGGDAYKLLSSKLDRALGGADEAYQKGSGGDRAASALLHMRGVPGVKFLDAGSRSAGEGTRNLVLFNGKDAKIVGKNGKSVAGQDRMNMNLSPEDRALERERVASARDREEGSSGRQVEPEPIPASAAEREGATARRRKDD